MQYDVMSDRDIIADDQRVDIMSHMQHAEVLDICPVTDPDVVHIAPDHGIEPHTAIFTYDDIADHDRGLFNKARLWDGRLDALKGANHVGTVGEVNGLPQGSTRVSLTDFLTLP